MSYLNIKNLTLSLKNFRLEDVSLDLPRGKVMIILGPSGSGKSVLLETIAGFHRPQRGAVRIDGREITALPPENRDIGFMFQDYALFPHKTVLQNITFSLQFRRAKDGPPGITVDQTMEMLRITSLAHRYPDTLSGGEKQRVALARALVRRPRLFLFDEPMSALDARAREELQEDLRTLFKELDMTVVYVTHDQYEALALGDMIAVINGGRVLQFGSRNDVFRRPADPFVARFVGMENLLPGQVTGISESRVEVRVGQAAVFMARSDSCLKEGQKVLVGVRPEDIRVHTCPPAEDESLLNNIWQGVVREVFPTGMFFKMRTDGPADLVTFLTRREMEAVGPDWEKGVWLSVPAEDVHTIASGNESE